MFVVPFFMIFGGPFVIPFLGYSASETAALLGGFIVLGEIIWFASIPLLGKEGFKAMKSKAFSFLKLKTGPISRERHSWGLRLFWLGLVIQMGLHILFVIAYLIVGAHPERAIFGLTFEEQLVCYFSILIFGIVCLIVGVYMLGADFAERLKHAFDWTGSEYAG